MWQQQIMRLARYRATLCDTNRSAKCEIWECLFRVISQGPEIQIKAIIAKQRIFPMLIATVSLRHSIHQKLKYFFPILLSTQKHSVVYKTKNTIDIRICISGYGTQDCIMVWIRMEKGFMAQSSEHSFLFDTLHFQQPFIHFHIWSRPFHLS